jgi:hypothetical protein
MAPMERDGLFVHVNDSIRKLAGQGPGGQTWEFICECPEVTCHTLVSLTLIEFDTRRASSPPVPVLAAQHDHSLAAG